MVRGLARPRWIVGTLGVALALFVGCQQDDDDDGSGFFGDRFRPAADDQAAGGPSLDDQSLDREVPETCEAVCAKLIDCWNAVAGRAGGGYGYGGYGYGYGYGGYGYHQGAQICGGYGGADGCGYGDGGYGHGYGGGGSDQSATCVAGCRADPDANRPTVQCIARARCPELLEACLGVDGSEGY